MENSRRRSHNNHRHFAPICPLGGSATNLSQTEYYAWGWHTQELQQREKGRPQFLDGMAKSSGSELPETSDFVENMVGMEAAALSAAITGVLKVVGNKLAALVIKEYSSIVGLKKDLQELQDLVQEINCRLGTEGYRARGDAPWLRKLKEVAYNVDDVVDEFQLMADKHDTDGGDAGFLSWSLHTKTESFIFQCKAAKKIKKIKNRFAEIVKQRTDLTAIFGHDPVSHINKSVVNMQTLPVGDEAAVLGREQEMHQIISNLVENNDKNKIKIVSIVGLGGSGKTTLAKLVFNEGKTIEKHFEVRLWVHVSQEFDYEKIIKKLCEAFADKDLGQPSLPYMSKRVQEGLTKKKFLIVMDDVWTESQNQWDQIMGYLKTGAPGSGVLLTTRSANVVEVVGSAYQFCLQRLSPDDSWQLFQQSFRMPSNFLESDFIKVGKEIVETCCGLPLAIKVLAGSLGGKELIGEWQAMRDILLDVEGEDSVSACLKLSYFHLPSNLKQCFTMCSLFPKGHLIDKQQLIDQWIAHDMISLTPGVDDLVHIGHRYFNSLVHVSFLQDVEEYDGAVRCKMHDFVHDLARSILSEEISTTITPEHGTSSTKGYSYYSLVKQPRNLARAIYVDGGRGIIFDKALKNSKHLRSITIENYLYSTAVPTAIFQVKSLKYLKISLLGSKALPEAISDIWNLQALYLTSTKELLELPKSIGKLIKLRTLSLSCCPKLRSLPSGFTTLKNLEYFKFEWCSYWLEFPDGIGNLTKLKALDLTYRAAPAGIGQLTRLEKLNSLCVSFDKKYAQISELASLSRISGKLSICSLRSLTDPCDVRQACLKQKENLHELELSWGPLHSRVNAEHEVAVLDGLEPPLGIKRLKISMFGGGQFACWMLNQVGRGVQGFHQFPFLTEMSLHDFPNLKHLDGLMQMPCLEKLHLKNMPVLESISGGPFPSLVELKMKGLHSLGVVWMVTDGTLLGKEECEGCSNHSPHQLGQLQIGSCLTNLGIVDCPKLGVKPYFPFSLKQLRWVNSKSNLLIFSPLSPPPALELRSTCGLELLQHISALQSLEIFHCNDLNELPECLGELRSMQKMTITSCNSLRNLPQSIGLLISLRELRIEECDALVQFPEGLGQLQSLCKFKIFRLQGLTCLPQSFCRLTTLQELNIGDCRALVELPEGLGELLSLCKLDIWRLPGLAFLPQSLCSLMTLKELHIGGCDALCELPEWLGEIQLHCLHKMKIVACRRIKSLPEWIKGLVALQRLEINACPSLEWRYSERGTVDWNLVSHIPYLAIGDPYEFE